MISKLNFCKNKNFKSNWKTSSIKVIRRIYQASIRLGENMLPFIMTKTDAHFVVLDFGYVLHCFNAKGSLFAWRY